MPLRLFSDEPYIPDILSPNYSINDQDMELRKNSTAKS